MVTTWGCWELDPLGSLGSGVELTPPKRATLGHRCAYSHWPWLTAAPGGECPAPGPSTQRMPQAGSRCWCPGLELSAGDGGRGQRPSEQGEVSAPFKEQKTLGTRSTQTRTWNVLPAE